MSPQDLDLTAEFKELSTAAEEELKAQKAKADDTSTASTATPVADASTEVASQETLIVEEEGTLTEEESLLVSKVSALTPEARLEKIEKLEKSGRANHTKEAKLLRETFGIEKKADETAGLDPDALQAAVAAEMERQGLNREDLLAQKEETQKIKALENSLREKGQDPALAIKIARNPEFVKAFYGDKISSLDLEDRVELALNKSKKFVIPAKGAGVTAPRGQEEATQAAKGDSLEDLISQMKTTLK